MKKAITHRKLSLFTWEPLKPTHCEVTTVHWISISCLDIYFDWKRTLCYFSLLHFIMILSLSCSDRPWNLDIILDYNISVLVCLSVYYGCTAVAVCISICGLRVGIPLTIKDPWPLLRKKKMSLSSTKKYSRLFTEVSFWSLFLSLTRWLISCVLVTGPHYTGHAFLDICLHLRTYSLQFHFVCVWNSPTWISVW